MTRLKISALVLLLTVSMLAFPFRARSVEPLQMRLGDMVEQSDYILIARVKGTYGDGPLMYADIEPITLVKGTSPSKIMYRNGISEHNPHCCKPGISYLFFLKNTPSGIIVTVGGRDAAIEVTSEGPA